MSWSNGRGLRATVLCSLGCGQLCRAALQLESERWYVGVAAPEGSVGGLLKAWQRGGKSGQRPQNFCSFEGGGFVLRGRRGGLRCWMLAFWAMQ